jgi:predicted permease
LGIGANAAIFSVVDTVLLRPLPYADPERLVRLYETMPERGPEWRGSVSWPNFRDWSEELRSFSGLAAYSMEGRNLSGAQGAERLQTLGATANLFQVLGVTPRLGRGFSPGEDAPGAPPVVMVSEGLWRRRFGADRALLGQTLSLDGQPYTVIGIAPDSARFPAGARPELIVPFIASGPQAENRGAHFLSVVGRLAPGVTLAKANTELREVSARLAEANPAAQTGRSASALLLTETVVGRVRPALLILQGAVLLVLLIACANVANLLLAQAAVRSQEVAIRMSLGAGRARLIRQMLVESFLLALTGSLLGLLLAFWGLNALQTLVASALPLASDIPLQGRVFGFLLLVAAGSAVLFGLAPALQATRTNLRAALTEAGAKASPSGLQQHFRSGLVVAEIALSLILLVGAGLLLRGFVTLLDTEAGFDERNVLTAHLTVPPSKYPREELAERLLKPILERVRSLPGVQSASAISILPIQGGTTNGDYAVEGEAAPEAGKELLAEYRVTSPDFFRAMGIPLLAGRDFTEQDGQGEQVIIVNQVLARRHFGQESPIGRRLLLGGRPVTIVGLVGDVRQAGLDQQALPEIHLPYNHVKSSIWLFNEATLVLRTSQAPTSVAADLRAAVRTVEADQPLSEIVTMEEVVSRSVAGRRLNLILLGTFALIALILATAGLYGVISYLVAQRTREIGIRVALGAQSRDVIGLVMRQGVVLAAMGIVAGLAGAFGLSRFVESLLYGVSARDPLTFSGLTVLLASIALVATWLPARRASRVDPIIAIRGE